ncbi:GNAT family N-acetyltransferase [Sporobolomyces salmoneus]|uniref:GNAT family N-acetyltransferase n=1 Tax=Sporobolomyces salmoneus TaxID=183962 RepID=UPI00317BC571
MLLVEPAFLPLQPLPHATTPILPAFHPSLPSSSSINSLRRSFTPFPLRCPTPRTPSVDSSALWLYEKPKPVSDGGGVTVRAMKSSDVPGVKQLQVECLPLAYPQSFYTLLLTNPRSLCLLAFSPLSPSTLLGCISGHLLPYTHCPLSSFDIDEPADALAQIELPIIYLTSLAVDLLARNQGLAFRLVQDLVAELCPATRTAVLQLHVEARNEAAIRLYRKLGLSETRRIRGYYKGVQGGGDAIEMRGVVSV